MSRCKECVKDNYQARSIKRDQELETVRSELARVNEQLAKEGLELGELKPDGTWTVIPLQKPK